MKGIGKNKSTYVCSQKDLFRNYNRNGNAVKIIGNIFKFLNYRIEAFTNILIPKLG